MHLPTLRHSAVVQATAFSLIAALTITMASPLVVMAAGNNGPATDHSTSVTAGEVQQALQYTPDVLSDSTQTATTSNSDSAIQAATAGAIIDVPKDASQGVTLTTNNGPALDIQLPNANQSGTATQVAPGVVAYSSNDGAANAVQATQDGGVRMLTVIDNPTAPTTYDYKVTVPGGGRIELTEDGGAVVLDANNQPISTVSTPWARDARGKRIRTWFTTDGTILTQHIRHNVRGVVYPVTADPAWFAIAAGIVVWAATQCAYSVIGNVGLDGVRWAIQRGNWYWNNKVEDALWNCAWGIAGGTVIRFAPASVKAWTATQIRNAARTILRWKI